MERKALWESIAAKRTIPVVGKIDDELYVSIRDLLAKMSAESPAPIVLMFDSAGGGAFNAFQLGDLINILPNETIGIVFDARSSAGVLSQFCTKRLIVPSGRFLIHSPRSYIDNCIDDEFAEERMRDALLMNTRYRKRTIDLFCSRTKMSEERVRELMKKGDNLPYYIYAEEALELKLVDAMVPADFKLFVPSVVSKPEAPTEDRGSETIVT